jgi:hypothetical protein
MKFSEIFCTQVYFKGWMDDESLLTLPDEESKLLLGDTTPFSFNVASPDIGFGRWSCNNLGAEVVGDCTI